MYVDYSLKYDAGVLDILCLRTTRTFLEGHTDGRPSTVFNVQKSAIYEARSRECPIGWGKSESCACAQLIKHYAMKECGGVYVWIPIFLTSVLIGGEWYASDYFPPGKRPPVHMGSETGWAPELLYNAKEKNNIPPTH
jgi:hypothetical protein